MTETLRSFDAVKSAYDELEGLQRQSPRDDDRMEQEIRNFLQAATRAGAFIANPDERRAAQDMLDYWFTNLLASSYSEMDAVSPRLADLRAGPEEPGGEDEAAALKARQAEELERVQQVIRLGALARQWRLNGYNKGYLLKGEALEDAKKYGKDDRDIAAFVSASEEHMRKAQKTQVASLVIISVLLAVLAGIAFWQAHSAMQAQERAEEETQEALAQKSRAEQLAADNDRARQEADALAEQARQDAEVLRTQLSELQRQGEVLNAALDVISRQVREGRLARSDLPQAIAELIEPEQRAEVLSFFTDRADALTGYDPDFLGGHLELPALTGEAAAEAFAEGRPVDYVNYSVVLNRRWEMPFYSAVNLDRETLRVLPRTQFQFEFLDNPDPRVPPGIVVAAEWFANGEMEIGYLANRSEIAWGPVFPQDQVAAAEIRDRLVDVTTNIVPQFDAFNQGPWAALERWTLTEHNPFARRVTIFTGPILSPDDVAINGRRVPRAFWKIAVSAAPAIQQAQVGPGYVVDAFVVPQFREGTGQRIEAGQYFDPETYRVPVAEIERLTGLEFAGIVRGTDDMQNALTPGDLLAARVGELDGPDAGQRRAVAQELASALRDGGLPWSQQVTVISALLDMGSDASMRRLSATGRLNLLFVLSQVPVASWNRPDAIDLKAGARGVAVSLEMRAAAGETEIGQQTREHLALLQANVGYGVTSPQTVYLQFTGLTRDGARGIMMRMRRLGWNMPGEERVKAAPRRDEVRYNPDVEADRAAAELLAADLRAAGRATAVAAPNRVIRANILEVWLGD